MKLSVLKVLFVSASLLLSSMSFAAAVNLGENDVVIQGYDPVAYFSKKKPVKGSAKYTAIYQGGIYRFASVENRDKFKRNPEKFAPQFGGYCAMGVALDKKLDVDPDAFYITGGKLYLNLNKDVQSKWMQDVSGNLKTARRNWSGIQDLSVAAANAED